MLLCKLTDISKYFLTTVYFCLIKSHPLIEIALKWGRYNISADSSDPLLEIVVVVCLIIFELYGSRKGFIPSFQSIIYFVLTCVSDAKSSFEKFLELFGWLFRWTDRSELFSAFMDAIERSKLELICFHDLNKYNVWPYWLK